MKQENKDPYGGYRDLEDVLAELEHLPVAAMRETLRKELREHPNFVLVGETGSGKTTCLPLLLLELRNELKLKGRIGITQPRRLAASSVTARVADMMEGDVGDQVGFQIRFENVTSHNTDIMFMTDGILLRKMQYDPFLLEFSIIMLDEVHEKNNNIYLSLGLLREVNQLRIEANIPPILIVVSSATIEREKFAKYIGGEDLDNSIEVPGKMFPVKVSYLTNVPLDYSFIQGAADKVKEIIETKRPGNILIFMPGKEEVNRTIEAIRSRYGEDKLAILPLHSELSSEDQDKVLLPTDKRLVIVATNIAETSITVPTLVHTIPSGFVKQIQFNPKTGIEQLVLIECSLSSLRQQLGRVGRTSEGECHYLFTEENMRRRRNYQVPEIQRSNLTQTILVLKRMGITDAKRFPFLDQPGLDFIMHAEDTLYSLGATNEHGEITEAGELMSDLSIKPELGAMVVEAIKSNPNSLNEICTLAALLNGKGLFSRPSNPFEARAADALIDRFYVDQSSDFMVLLNVWQSYVNSGYNKDWAIANFLNDRSLEEAKNIRLDIIEVLESRKIYVNQDGKSRPNKDALGKAVTSGFLNNLLVSDGKTLKKLAGYKNEIIIHPDSLFYGRRFDAGTILTAGEIFMNTEGRVYASKCLLLKPEWLREVAPELSDVLRQKNKKSHNFGGKHHSKNIYSHNGRHRK